MPHANFTYSFAWILGRPFEMQVSVLALIPTNLEEEIGPQSLNHDDQKVGRLMELYLNSLGVVMILLMPTVVTL